MSSISALTGNLSYTPIPNLQDTIRILGRMHESRVLILETPKTVTMRNVAAGNAGVWPLVFLNVDGGDVREGLVAGKVHEDMAVKCIKQNMGNVI